MGSVKLTVLATFGQPRRRDRVRVIRLTLKGEETLRVQWKEGDRRRNQSFADTRKGLVEAKAFAEALSDRLAAKQVQIEYLGLTVRQLFERYINALVDDWRPRTLELKKERWQKFELFIGKNTPAHYVTRERLDDFKRAMLENKHSPNQVAHTISNAKAVFRFGVDRDLIPPTKLLSYRTTFGKDVKRVIEMGEYSAPERQAIIACLDPRDSRQWRAWALATVFAHLASRQRATRHLEWRDIDFEEGVTWRRELDKMGNERVQPITDEVKDAFLVALGWRQRDGYTGPFVFYAVKKSKWDEEPYTYQGYSYAHREAEKRAGIRHVKYRGAHGFRRGVSGDVFDATGSEHKAAEWIGDKSVKIVRKHYLLKRKDRQKDLASLVAKKMQPNATGNENVLEVEDSGEVNAF
jgi:integrase